uniref:Carbonic anhydrase 8 n=3 Tax=Telluraves TaxID=3073808 RepID=A0A8B9N911_9AVES
SRAPSPSRAGRRLRSGATRKVRRGRRLRRGETFAAAGWRGRRWRWWEDFSGRAEGKSPPGRPEPRGAGKRRPAAARQVRHRRRERGAGRRRLRSRPAAGRRGRRAEVPRSTPRPRPPRRAFPRRWAAARRSVRAGRVWLSREAAVQRRVRGLPVTAFPCVSGVEWGLIFPDANGEYQSPINLNSREAKYDPSLLEVRLSPNYVVCRDCEVINDGHSIQIALKSKSVLIGGPLPRGHEFELHDVRFHWGRENQRGSEHTVNFKAFPMEIGKEHVGLKAVTEILQDIQYKGKSKTIPCFNPNSLLPDPLLRDYWVYEGSLTIPPCSEGVTWILFRYPLTVSQVQIEEFRRLRTHVKGAELLEGCDGILGDNFRPTQPLSDRVIRAAFQ